MLKKNLSNLAKKSNHLKTFGNSMVPLLYNEDIINLKKTSFSRLAVNDLISFKRKNHIITHRIIYKKGNYLISKGDHNFKDDGKIYNKEVLGKAISAKRSNILIDPETIYLFQSTIYFNQIKLLSRLFDQKKINFVFLKGLPIHLYFEKTHPRRLYVDCDILIDKTQYKKAVRVFSFLSYKPLNLHTKSSIKKGKYLVEESYFKMVNDFKVVFDLHTEPAFLMTQLGNLNSIYPQKLIKKLAEKLINEKQTPEINGEKLPILSSENLLLYLALHLFHHNFKGYYRYELMDNLIKNKKFDYKNITETALEYKLSNFIYPVFLLLKKYYKTPIPGDFLKQIQLSNMHSNKLQKIMKTKIFEEETRIDAGVGRFTLIYSLSPEPFHKKALVFTNPEVIQSIFSVFKTRISSFSKRTIHSRLT